MSTVETGSGPVRGRSSAAGLAFLGVPYAVPGRWARPRPPAPWRGVRDAVTAGPAAPQPRRPIGVFTHGEPPGTDELGCLTLNVFTPSLDGARPVLVWVHGGGFTIGHASASLYDGAWLAERADLVVVTVNYRLGSLGWLAHPALAGAAGDAAANWGMLDQIAALDWVQANISAFGGDPRRATVAGQSAGALIAMDLLVSPQARGRFRRAIVQSPPMADVAQAAEVGARWAEAMFAAAGGVERLRTLPAEQVVHLHEELLDDPAFRGTRGGASPMLDPATIPVSPAQAPGASPEVEILAGHNADEGTFFFRSPWRPSPPVERIPGIVAHLAHAEAPETVLAEHRDRAAAHGGPTDELSLLVAIATEAMVAAPLAGWARERAAAGARVYRYRVDHPGAGPDLGATHTVEVPLLFGTYADGGPGERLGGQAPRAAELSLRIAGAWGRFVHDGDPGWAPLAGAPDALGVFA